MLEQRLDIIGQNIHNIQVIMDQLKCAMIVLGISIMNTNQVLKQIQDQLHTTINLLLILILCVFRIDMLEEQQHEQTFLSSVFHTLHVLWVLCLSPFFLFWHSLQGWL